MFTVEIGLTIVLFVISGVIGFISWIGKDTLFSIKNSITGVNVKLDSVLGNQQAQQITIAEMRKDIETTIEISKDLKSTVNHIDGRVQEHAVVLAELKQWKKDRENV
jgi:hypothetical protein